jgi:hypothetical protein
MTAKSISIKDTGCKFGGCALKAVELIAGGLSRVPESGLRMEQFILTVRQKSAAGIVRHAVGKANEALQDRKAESTDRPGRERWWKAQTAGSGK